MSDSPKEAIIAWWGRSKEILSDFPPDVKSNLGFSLRLLQSGEQPTDYRSLPSIGKGVFELRDQDESGWYRVIYVSRINNVIHVIHAFEKDTLAIPKKEIATAQQNLKHLKEFLLEEKKHAKRNK